MISRCLTRKHPRGIVLPSEFKHIKKNKIISLANRWADFFIPSKRVSFERDTFPLDYCAEVALCKWQSVGVTEVRRMLFDQGDCLDRACHNKKYDISYLLSKKNPITDGFSLDSPVLLIPEIPDTMTWGNFIEAPKKYLPFLIGISHPFDKIIFYHDPNGLDYYEFNNLLYINSSCENEPIELIYSIIAKKILPMVSGKLWELQSFQNMGISSIDKTSYSLEQRFINDWVAYKLGQSSDVFVVSFFSGLGI